MREIPRGCIILKPKPQFVAWVNSWGSDEDRLSLEEAVKDPDVILIPEFESTAEAMEFVRFNAMVILETTLQDWCADKDLWPEGLDFELLSQWFEITTASVVFDAVEPEDGRWELN